MESVNIRELNERIQKESEFVDMLTLEMGKVIVGQKHLVENLLIGLLSGGHILLEGVPGLAKTLAINTLSQAVDAKFNRIQFTPDLLPADVIGTLIYSQKNESFEVHKGPVFANFVLADEINRSPAKVQSALLEAMQEHQVTIGEQTFKLPEPFLVMATQNPIEQEGTYPLPEAQLDRFMFNVRLDYPSFEEEVSIVKQTTVAPTAQVQRILSADEIIAFQEAIRRMPVADNVVEYAVRLVASTRPAASESADTQNSKFKNQNSQKYISWGAGPRASQYLIVGARTYAALHGKYSPDAEDVRAVAHNVLRHRLVRNYFAEAEGITTDQIISDLLRD